MQLAQRVEAGLDTSRLERITEHLEENYIRPGKIVGCQTLVARHGQVAHFSSLGEMDRERGTPMREDTIFRIYSMTKPITSVALMTLYERGLFQLNDPVSRVLPEWRDQRVWVSGEGEQMVTKAPERPVTFRHLLSHTAGLTYGGGLPGAGCAPGRGGDAALVHGEAGARAPALRAGRALDVFTRDGRLRRAGGAALGQALRRVLARGDLRAAGHG